MSDTTLTWTVVNFTSDNSVSVVPTKWIHDGNKCYWPPFTTDKITNAIKTGLLNTCWPSHEILLFRNATYESYELARLKARKAEQTSDLNTEDDEKSKKRRRIHNKISSSEDSSDGDCYVKTPPRLNNLKRKIFIQNDAENDRTKNINLSEKNNPVTTQPEILSPRSQSDRVLMDHTNLNNIEIHTPKSLVSSVTPHLGSVTSANPTPICSRTSCHCCPDLKQYLREILKQQNIIRTRLNELSHMVEQMNSNPNKGIEADESAFAGFNMPLESVEQFKELNIFLKNPEEFAKGVTQMSKMGGSNTYDFAKRVLQTVLTNELATLYSWLGRREKFKFSELPFSNLIIAAAEKSGKTTDKKQIEEAISSWLRRAKDRKTKNIK